MPTADDSDLAALADLPRRATAAADEIKDLIELADPLAEAGYGVAGALSADLSAGQAFEPDDYVRNVAELRRRSPPTLDGQRNPADNPRNCGFGRKPRPANHRKAVVARLPK